MKITPDILEQAIDRINERYQCQLITIPDETIYELAHVLTGLIDPEQLSFSCSINPIDDDDENGHGLVDTQELLQTIKEHAKPGDMIAVAVADEDFDEIGSARWIYQYDGEFMKHINSSGAAIELHLTLKEMEDNQEQAQA
jgi:hypothetical protein